MSFFRADYGSFRMFVLNIADFALLESQNLISRKISVMKKS